MLASACALALGVPTAASAQIAPPTRDELAPPQIRDDTRRAATLTIDGGLERAPCALDDPRYADIRLTLNSVTFAGAERAPELSLRDTYEDYLGRDLPLSVLCDIRARARAALSQAGYLATVEIPEQRLADGNAELRIVFGRLTAIRVRGDAGPSERLIESYLSKLTGQEVFNTRDAERYLLLADDIPGVDVRLSLRPAAGGQPGDLIGEIAVVRRRGALDLNIQNYGSRALGRFGGLLNGQLYDLTGLGDRTSLAVFTTADFDEQQTVQIGHEFRVGSEGLILGGQFTYSHTDPSLGLAGFDVQSDTYFASAFARYPLVRRRTESVFVTGGFDYVDQDVELNDFPLTRDRVRMAYLRTDFSAADAASVSRVGGYSPAEPKTLLTGAIELRQGLDVFGTSPDCRANLLACAVGGQATPSRIEADPTPLLLRTELSGEYRPIPDITFALRLDGQVSGDPLPAFEEFSAGTYSIGRGYDPGAVLGDSGFGVGAELRYGSAVPEGIDKFAVQPFLFTDAAWAWNEDPSRRPLNPDRLWSAGGGVRFAYGGGMQGNLTVAVPLERPDLAPDRGDVRVLFSLTARLLPWSF